MAKQLLTFDIPEHRVDRQMHAPPQPHVTWISLLDHTLPLVKAPVHVGRDEVGALVMAPDESRVHLNNEKNNLSNDSLSNKKTFKRTIYQRFAVS